jgi:hypothetical protein
MAVVAAPPWASLGPDTTPPWTSSLSSSCTIQQTTFNDLTYHQKMDLLHLDSSFNYSRYIATVSIILCSVLKAPRRASGPENRLSA